LIKNIIFSRDINCWISITKYIRYQYGVTQVTSIIVHLRNSNKQQLILTKFYADSASSIGN